MGLVFRNLGGNPYSGLMRTADSAFGKVGRAYMGLGDAQFKLNMYEAEQERRQAEMDDARWNNTLNTLITGVAKGMEYENQKDTMSFNKNLKLFGLEDAGLNSQLKYLTPEARQRVLTARSNAINDIDAGKPFKLTNNGLFGVQLSSEDFTSVKTKTTDIKNISDVYKDYVERSDKKRGELKNEWYNLMGYIDESMMDPSEKGYVPKWRLLSDAEIKDKIQKGTLLQIPKGRISPEQDERTVFNAIKAGKDIALLGEDKIRPFNQWIVETYQISPKNESFENFSKRVFGVDIPSQGFSSVTTVDNALDMDTLANNAIKTSEFIQVGENEFENKSIADNVTQKDLVDNMGLNPDKDGSVDTNMILAEQIRKGEETGEKSYYGNLADKVSGYIKDGSSYVVDAGKQLFDTLEGAPEANADNMQENLTVPETEFKITDNNTAINTDGMLQNKIIKETENILEGNSGVKVNKNNMLSREDYAFYLGKDGKIGEIQMESAKKYIYDMLVSENFIKDGQSLVGMSMKDREKAKNELYSKFKLKAIDVVSKELVSLDQVAREGELERLVTNSMKIFDKAYGELYKDGIEAQKSQKKNSILGDLTNTEEDNETNTDIDGGGDITSNSSSAPTSGKGEGGTLITDREANIYASIIMNEIIEPKDTVKFRGIGGVKDYDVELPPETAMLIMSMEAKVKDGKLVSDFKQKDGKEMSFGLMQMQKPALKQTNKALRLNGMKEIPESHLTGSEPMEQILAGLSYLKYVVMPESQDRLGDKWNNLSQRKKMEIAYLRYNGGIIWYETNKNNRKFSEEEKEQGYAVTSTGAKNLKRLQGKLDTIGFN